ncbi:MAG: RHS repeat-associated core domain-containing protein [Anaerolineae bacterium]
MPPTDVLTPTEEVAEPVVTPITEPTLPTFDSPLPTPEVPPVEGSVALGTLTPAGGELASSDGRVRVAAPAGAVTQPTGVRLRVLTATRMTRDQMGAALHFSLEPDVRFARPLTLTVNLQGLVDLKNLPAGWHPYLAYREDAAALDWHYVPLQRVNWETGEITAQVEHFSEWESGVVSENGWLLSFRDAQVAGFRGAASYDIPLSVPPGRGGTTPQLNLSYNSDRVNGILANVQSDWAGLGWSLDAPQIVRNVDWCPWGGGQLCIDSAHPDYTLVMDGAGYTLVPDPSIACIDEVCPAQGAGRYHTDQETFFYIEKALTTTNQLGAYWLVRTKDGTRYYFGATPDAEQTLCNVAYLPGGTVYRWRLNRVVDVWGNEAVYEYHEEESGGRCQRASYLAAIRYNRKADGAWGTEILFDRHTRLGEPDGTDRPAEYLFFQQEHLDKVRVRQDGQAVREYRLTYDFNGESRRLQALTEYGSAGGALPATTFAYQVLNNTKPEWHPYQTYPYSRLTAVNNGYGGRIEVDYQQTEVNNLHGYHYRVQERRTLDGRGNTTRRGYTYGPACMDATGSPCDDGYRHWGLKGYAWSAERTYDYDGRLLTAITSTYVLPWPLTGRVAVLETTDAPGQTQQRTETGWGYNWLIASTVDYVTGVAFFRVDAVTETLVSGGVAAATRVDYAYDAYGNVAGEYRAGNVALWGDETRVEREYVANETAWIVGLPARQTSGGQETLYLYDNQPWGTAPLTGALTQVRVGGGTLWMTTTTGYDSWGNPTVVTDALGRVTRTRYDAVYRLFPISTTNALTQTTLTQWDARWGVPLVVTDANGAPTRAGYDAFGRLISVTYPAETAPAIRYAYPAGGPLTAPWVISGEVRVDPYSPTPLYRRTWTFYDGLGRAVQTQTQAENGWLVTQSTAYDALGRPITVTLPYTVAAAGGTYLTPTWGTLPKTVTRYDALGRVIQVIAADGTTTTRAYRGWQELALDAEGRQTQYEQDGLGRLVAAREYTGVYGTPTWNAPNPLETRYWYDARGNLIAVRDSLGNVTRMEYDALGRKVALDDPSMGHWEYRYDAVGNLVWQKDARGQALTFQYDALNRPVRKQGASLLAEYSYDQGLWGIGRRTAMTDTTGTTTWVYDARGRTLTETRVITGAGTFVTGWRYDAAGNVITTTYPTGEVVTATYNLRGLPTGVRSQTYGQDYARNVAYNGLGQMTALPLGNGLTTQYTYWPHNFRLRQMQVSSNLLNLNYSYDRVGNITALTDTVNSGQVQTFTYDARDRLVWARTSITGSGQYNEAYGYDRMGNIVTRTVGVQALTYTYGVSATLPAPAVPPTLTRRVYFPLAMLNWAAGPAYPPAPPATTGQPFAVLSATTGFRAVYDPNGNMTLRVEVAGAQRITYTQAFDIESRLTAVTNTVTGQVTRFVYDGDGNRVLQLLPGGGRTAYIGAVEIAITGAQRITKTYYSLGGSLAALRVISPSANVLYYLHGDHLGSVSLVTCGNTGGCNGTPYQGAVSRQLYSPYGTVRWSQGVPPTDIGFTGQRADATGLMFYQARYYSAELGRFISPDTIVPSPANPQSLNRYAYVLNSPLRYTDPSGHDPLDKKWEEEFFAVHGVYPTDKDRLYRLYSLITPGSGPNGSWLLEDWLKLSDDLIYSNQQSDRRGLEDLANQVETLASYYESDEADQFIRAFALLWGGVPYETDPLDAMWMVRNGPVYVQLGYGNEGFNPDLVDPDHSIVHHYAPYVMLGYYLGSGLAVSVNTIREMLDPNYGQVNQADILLGNIGAAHGGIMFRKNMSTVERGLGLARPSYLAYLIRRDLGN